MIWLMIFMNVSEEKDTSLKLLELSWLGRIFQLKLEKLPFHHIKRIKKV